MYALAYTLLILAVAVAASRFFWDELFLALTSYFVVDFAAGASEG